MHLGNGAVTPACAVIGFASAGAGLLAAGYFLRRSAQTITRPLMLSAAVLGAAIFALQAINVPVLPFCSAHLVGGVLLAWVLGVPLGMLTMAAVLIVQALLLGDGGLMALGVNILNMAIVPGLLVGLLRGWQMQSDSSIQQPAWRAGVAAGLSVFVSAGLIALQVALFRTSDQLQHWSAFAGQMIWTHALIGLAEAMLTLALLAMLGRLHQPGALAQPKLLATGVIGLAGSLLILPFASAMPDGYESAAERSGMLHTIESLTGINQYVAHWQQTIVSALPATEWLMLLAGALFTGLLLLGIAVMLGRSATVPVTSTTDHQ